MRLALSAPTRSASGLEWHADFPSRATSEYPISIQRGWKRSSPQLDTRLKSTKWSLAWAVHRGAVAIPKSVHSVRQKANLAAAKIELSEKEIHEIDALNRDYSHFVGEVWTENGSPSRRKWLSQDDSLF